MGTGTTPAGAPGQGPRPFPSPSRQVRDARAGGPVPVGANRGRPGDRGSRCPRPASDSGFFEPHAPPAGSQLEVDCRHSAPDTTENPTRTLGCAGVTRSRSPPQWPANYVFAAVRVRAHFSQGLARTCVCSIRVLLGHIELVEADGHFSDEILCHLGTAALP